MQVRRAYANWAKAVIATFWDQAIEKRGYPMLSKAQIREQITAGVERFVAQDGDPATWTFCDHCEGTGIYESYGPDKDQIGKVGQPDTITTSGLCYQCNGKGSQSEHDRRRNAGYQAIKREGVY